MENIYIAAIQLALTIVAFLIGKYLFPKITPDVITKMDELYIWAEKFVVWAREFMKDKSGQEKMLEVMAKLQEIAAEAGIKVTMEQLQAIAQSAYEAMKAGEASNKAADVKEVTATLESQAISATPMVVINTGTTAIATDHVPEDALEENPDGTINTYDVHGKKTGTISKEEAEAAEKAIENIIIEK